MRRRSALGFEHLPETGTQNDGTVDPSVGVIVTEAGKDRWRQRLADADAARDRTARAELLSQLRQSPAA